MLRTVISVFVLFGAGSAFLLAGCGALDDNSAVRGTVRVLLTDAPIDDWTEVNVTIERVELLGDSEDGESSMYVLSEDDQTFNLLALQDGVTALLADAAIPAGRYHQLRLIVNDEADILTADDQTLKIPSGAQSGIKVQFPAFEIDSDADVIELTVDFDAAESFVSAGASGQYIFRPVIKAKAAVVNGENVEVTQDPAES